MTRNKGAAPAPPVKPKPSVKFSNNVEKILWKGIFKWKEMHLIVSINVKIYNAERRKFSIHISDDPDGHLQPDHWFKFVINFRFRLSCHWRFIDGVVNTFSNAHYSQTPHPNWTKPTQGASGNVRISFGNNMGSKKKLELFIKVCCLGEMFNFTAIFPICTLLPTGLSAKGKGEYIIT